MRTTASSSSGTGTGGGANTGGSTNTGGGVPGLPEAVAWGMNTSHSGAQPGETIYPPLQERWAVTLGESISYPLIAGGRVFVTVRSSQWSYGTELYALDLQTGETLWGPVWLGGALTDPIYASNPAYDGGKVFITNRKGLLKAFDAATGATLWELPPPPSPPLTSAAAPPTARNGRVYFGYSVGGGGYVAGVDGATGAVLWSATVGRGGSSPVVTDTGVYFSYYYCDEVHAFHPLTGAVLWKHQKPQCFATAGATPVLFDGKLYMRNPPENVIFDAAAGALLGTFPTANWLDKTRLPAFHGALGFFVLDSGLTAKNLSTFDTVWSLPAGSKESLSAPILVNGAVYILSTTGELRALSESDGALLWSTDTGGPIAAVDDTNLGGHPLVGLAAGGGALVVPAGPRLVAYW